MPVALPWIWARDNRSAVRRSGNTRTAVRSAGIGATAASRPASAEAAEHGGLWDRAQAPGENPQPHVPCGDRVLEYLNEKAFARRKRGRTSATLARSLGAGRAELTCPLYEGMTGPERVHKFLTARTPAPVCDDCIAAHADVSPRQQVNPIAATLGLTTDFSRDKGNCSMCKADKLVTRSLRFAR